MPETETHGPLQARAVEALLDRHLGPVRAPAELWDRVQGASSRGSDRRLVWALATAVLVLIAAAGLYTHGAGARDETAAFQALVRGADSLEFLSASGPAMRTWIRNQTGMDVPLQSAPEVTLIGAHLVEPGTIEIAYRIGERRAALVVSADGSKDGPQHWTVGARHREEAKVSGTVGALSWTRAGQRYILACAVPGDLQAACLICHADGRANTQWQTAVN